MGTPERALKLTSWVERSTPGTTPLLGEVQHLRRGAVPGHCLTVRVEVGLGPRRVWGPFERIPSRRSLGR
jgi:hypothetical protein